MRAKGQLIEKFIVCPLGITVDIRLTKNDMLFRAEYGGKKFHSKNGEDIKRQVGDFVRASSELKWTPFIAISLEQGHFCEEGSVDIIFGIRRFYIGKNDDVLRELSWSVWERLHHEKTEGVALSSRLIMRSDLTNIDPETEDTDGGEMFYRPYNEKLWKGLEALHKSLQEAKDKILQLITTEEGISRIAGGGKLALTSKAGNNRGTPK